MIFFYIGTQKSYTSSVAEYIKHNYNIQFVNDDKESHTMVSEKIHDFTGNNYLDASQGYLYKSKFIENIKKNIGKYRILITYFSLERQYQSLFNMFFEASSLTDNFNFEKKFLQNNFTKEQGGILFNSFSNKRYIEKSRIEFKEYKKFVNRPITDLETLFFCKNEQSMLFNDFSKKKIDNLIKGNIDNFFKLELVQFENDNWDSINVLQPLFIPKIYLWLIEHNLSKEQIDIISFKSEEDLQKQIDDYFQKYNFKKIKQEKIKYISPGKNYRKKKSFKPQLSNQYKKKLQMIEISFKKKLGIEY